MEIINKKIMEQLSDEYDNRLNYCTVNGHNLNMIGMRYLNLSSGVDENSIELKSLINKGYNYCLYIHAYSEEYDRTTFYILAKDIEQIKSICSSIKEGTRRDSADMINLNGYDNIIYDERLIEIIK